jgi:RNA polymerase sigma-70 factor (ECF subfamily)
MNLLDHRPRLLRYATQIVKNTAIAEELVDEALGRAVWKGAQCRGTNLGAWLSVIVRNLAYQHLRRSEVEKRRLRVFLGFRFPDPVELAIRKETSREVGVALDRLRPMQREALTLFELDDLPASEVARRMGISASSVLALVYRARTRLRRLLKGMSA